ncbi:MAG: nitroreductase family protein [Propionibacteriaceae bacterium]|nr:nitroreductase family protein [Propionibacteriaceae bacterium]
MNSTETLDVIARRYACRSFLDTPVPPEQLRLVAEAGVKAPSALNRQPWRLVVVSDRSTLTRIDQVGMARLKDADPEGFARVQSRGGLLLYNAPAVVLIASEPLDTPWPVAMDAGIVASHVALAATSLGLDTCVAAMPGLAFEDPELRAQYMPEGFDFAIAVLMGYAATPGRTPHEPDVTKIRYV